MNKHLRRLAVVPAAGVIALAVTGPASAHVTVTPSDTTAGAYSMLTFSVPHGCDGSATTKISIKLPDDVIEATPTRDPFYDVENVTNKLDTPITGEDGDQITEKVDQIIYTAKTPLPDDQRDTMEVQLQIPEGDTGKTLVFPTIQTCEQGETAWTEIPAPGAAQDSVEHPAPAFKVTAADTGTEATPAAETSASADTSDTTPAAMSAASATDSDDNSGNGLAIAGLVAGLLGLLFGSVALARTRGRA